jgi:hypothetical protein
VKVSLENNIGSGQNISVKMKNIPV